MTLTPAEIQTTQLPGGRCPSCAAALDAVTGLGTPEPGALTICAYCRVFLVFAEDLSQRVLTNEAWMNLAPDLRALLTKLREDMATWPVSGHRTS